MSSSPGSKWMSEAPRSTASLMTRCTSWMTDASSPEAPKLIGCSRRSYSGPVGAVGEALEQRVDVLGRGDRRADLVAGHHRDVVLSQHVGRVGHGDEQRAVA